MYLYLQVSYKNFHINTDRNQTYLVVIAMTLICIVDVTTVIQDICPSIFSNCPEELYKN